MFFWVYINKLTANDNLTCKRRKGFICYDFKYLSEIQVHTDNIRRVDSTHKLNKISYRIL